MSNLPKTVCGIITIIIVSIIVLGLVIALPIASYVIASEHRNEPCYANSLMPLDTWLYVNASVELASIGLIVVFYVLLIVTKNQMWAIPLVILVILNTCYLIAWNVIGAVSLFRDSSACRQAVKPIWVMMLVSLIFQWITIWKICFVHRSRAQL
jgi:hypothetical protein